MTGLVGSAETLLGLGAIALDGDGAQPHLLAVQDEYAEDLRELLRRALVGTARLLGGQRAA